MTPTELDELERLEREATEGPWGFDDYVVNPGDTPGQFHVFESLEDDGPLLSTSLGTYADVRLVVKLRNAAKDLIAAARRTGQ